MIRLLTKYGFWIGTVLILLLIMELSQDKSSVVIEGETLRVNQTIDYKKGDEHRVSIGKITQFRHPGYNQSDKESVWMFVTDSETGDKEWISCHVWYEQKQNGIFGKPKPATNDTNSKSEDTEEYPF